MSESRLYSINGIWCGSCAKSVEKRILTDLEIESSVDLATQTLKLWGQELPVLKDLSKVLEPAGYSVSEFRDIDSKIKSIKLFEKKLLRRLSCVLFSSIWVMSLSISGYLEIMGPLSPENLRLINWMMVFLGFPGLTYGGSFVYAMAWQNLKIKKLTIDSLVTLSVFTCSFLSVLSLYKGGADLYLDSALMVLLVFSVIKYLEHKIFQVQAKSIYALEEERLKDSIVVKNGKKFKKKNAQIKSGQTISLEVGDFLFFDGIIVSGEAIVNVSSSNGEQDPRTVRSGEKLSYGSIVLSGELLIEVDQAIGERQVDKSFSSSISKFHESKNDNSHWFVDTAIEYAVPSLFGLSLISFFYQYFYIERELVSSVLYSLSLVLVFCPCVLYLSRPLVLLTLVKSLKDQNIFLRNPSALANLKKSKLIIFDKTGTLTGHNHEINLIRNQSGFSTDKIWSLVGGMESKFNHPIATAVARKLWSFKLEPLKVDANLVPSQGVESYIGGEKYFFGRPQNPTEANQLHLLKDEEIIATFQLITKKNEDRKNLIKYLEDRSIKKVLLTGDSEKNTDHFIEEQNLRFDKVYADKSLRDKGLIVQNLQNQLGDAVYIGDGENDIEALAKSKVSISLSNSSEGIKSASDITLPCISLINIQTLLNAGERYEKRIWQNYVLAGLYNILAIYFSFGGYLKPSYAILAMSVSTILLLFNSTRNTLKINCF